MQVGLASHEAIEHWEGECGCRGTSEGTRGPSPMQGPPSSGFQSWEKESPQNLTIKTSSTLAVWVRWKEPENQDVPLKTHFLWAPERVRSSVGTRDICGKTELRGARARAGRIAAIAPLLGSPLE